MPLYIFCGDWLVTSRLRRSDQDASAGTIPHLEAMVTRIRSRWPDTQIVLRADSGFVREHILAWCEELKVDYVIGLAKKNRLKDRIRLAMELAKKGFQKSGESAREFTSFEYKTLHSWSRQRRVIGKAEVLSRGENPRFVVTSLNVGDAGARKIYEEIYCARGDAENRIREQLGLFADQMSTHWTKSNQLRLYFSALAYLFICLLRRAAHVIDWQGLRPTTIRLRLLKIGAQVQPNGLKLSVAAPISGSLSSSSRLIATGNDSIWGTCDAFWKRCIRSASTLLHRTTFDSENPSKIGVFASLRIQVRHASRNEAQIWPSTSFIHRW